MRLPGEVTDRAVMLYMTGAVCTQPAQVLDNDHAVEVIQNFINELRERDSQHLRVFGSFETEGDRTNPSPAAEEMAHLLSLLCDMTPQDARVSAPDCRELLEDTMALAEFVEALYDHWRGYERYLMLETAADDSRDSAIEGHMPFIRNNQEMNHLIRDAYRQIERNLRGYWPRVYRQTPGGANMSLLIERIPWDYPADLYEPLLDVRMVRLALLVPPVILYPRSIRRQGRFIEVPDNPLEDATIDPATWLCIPVLVGKLRFHVYFHRDYLALATSLVNLFELSGHDEAREKPDGILLFGLDPEQLGREQTVFHIDEENDVAIGAIGAADEHDYFGYFKKMMLTLHNVIMMRRGRLPIHGAMAHLRLREGPEQTIIIVGDSGAGKSETLEAFRELAEDWISDMIIIFDDMGTLEIEDSRIVGYGTEIGAFVRLDDIDPGYAFGRFDRGVFMNPHRQNARLVLPISEYSDVVAGYDVSMLLYANNYEPVTEATPIIEFFQNPGQSLDVFREGKRAAKGTTDERGLVETYFANPFGPVQRREMHEEIAERHFAAAHQFDIPVGQIRTRLGIEGMERTGCNEAAEALFRYLIAEAKRAEEK